MRRLIVMVALLAGLAVPAALQASPGDGTLVVKKGEAPAGVPVVVLTVTGSVIGHIDYGKIVIDAGPNPDAVPQVVGAGRPGDSARSDTAQVWKGTDFTFRAVGGRFVILIYGSGVNVVAAGKGTVRLAGLPDTPHGDGVYSLNGNDFLSLPGVPTDKLTIGANG